MVSVIRNASSDQIFRSATSYLSKFFSHGWGETETLYKLAKFQRIVLDKRKMVDDIYKVLESTHINLSSGKKLNSSLTLYKGEFVSPLTKLIPGMLPQETEKAHFQIVMPDTWNEKKPMCIHLAGTGDHFFWRRRHFMAVPLAKDYNIGSIILENPFYGSRKPKNQVRSAVNNVSDIFVMGAALLFETVTLLLWCKRNGYGPLGVTGISMGGHMASIASSGWFEPLAIVPCLSWSSAAPAFTEGVLSHTVQWEVLEKQLKEVPEYKKLLRRDKEFQEMLKTHYITSKDQTIEQHSSIKNKINETPSRLAQIYSSFHNLLPSLRFSSYVDLRGKKMGPIALEIDFMKYLESIPRQLYNTTSNYINIEQLREMLWRYDPVAPQPSEEVIAYMTALMDQATHLSHFNKPHDDSPVIYVVAEHDKYIPRECYHVTPKDIWKQTQVRTINTGHALAILQHQDVFRLAIKDAFQQLGCNFK